MLRISLRSVVAQVVTRGGRSVVSRRNFSSSDGTNERILVARILARFLLGGISAAAGYGTAHHVLKYDETEDDEEW